MRREYRWDERVKQLPDRDSLVWLYKNYVLNCPVPGVSYRGVDFKQLCWSGHRQVVLRELMINSSSLISSAWEATDKKDALIALLASNNVLDTYSINQEFAYYFRADKSVVGGLFYLIRNALAHGSFHFHRSSKGDCLALETSKNGQVRGRALVRISTLRKWRSILNHSDNYFNYYRAKKGRFHDPHR